MTEIEKSLQQSFLAKGWTLSLAESCTGGALSARLTKVPGCSAYLLGSVVTYSNELKMNILGVSPETIEKFGAVSQECVIEMAEGVKQLTKSQISVSISGIAGPDGGTAEKPVGTVWAAIASDYQPTFAWKMSLSGSRADIIQEASILVIKELLKLVN